MITTLRSAGSKDLPDLHLLDAAIFGPTGEEPYPLPVLRQFLDLFPDLFLVAEDPAGSLVGYAVGATSSTPRSAWILSVGVCPGSEGLGIGRRLCEELIIRLGALGARDIHLSVIPHHKRPIRLYEELGFEYSDLVRDFFGPGEDRVLMVRRDLDE